jgi:hypothetical protein
MRKGKGSFVTVVSDIEAGNLIEMIDSHRQQDIIEALITILRTVFKEGGDRHTEEK